MEMIKAVVRRYQDVVHTQDWESFDSLWSHSEASCLISGVNIFRGRESIYQDFLVDRIGAKFSRIDLIADSLEICPVTEDLVTVMFSYHTECILRESGESYGIRGLETQVIVKEDGQWRLLHVHYSIA